MPRTLVTYFSKTGNTKKIADAIYTTLAGNKAIKPVNELQEQEIEEYSLIFIGFPVYSHSIPFPLEGILRNIPPNKKIALFSTHGSLTGSRLSREALEYAFVLALKAKYWAVFHAAEKSLLRQLMFWRNRQNIKPGQKWLPLPVLILIRATWKTQGLSQDGS